MKEHKRLQNFSEGRRKASKFETRVTIWKRYNLVNKANYVHTNLCLRINMNPVR
jgi:hypothetical protein